MLKPIRVIGILFIMVVLAMLLCSFPAEMPAIAQDDLPLKEGTALSPFPEGEYVPGQIIVKFKETALRTAQASLKENLETKMIYSSPFSGFQVLQVPEGKSVEEMVKAYSRQAIVEYAEPNYIERITWTPNDEYYSYQWHFDQINLEAAWDLDTTSPNYGGDPSIIVAVIDTGIAYENYGVYAKAPDLANTNFTSGWDFVNNDAHPNDDVGHGTHVCGTIAQSTNNGQGVAGIAFNTTIMPIKSLGTSGGTHAQFADAFHYAADHGARIINYSGGGVDSETKRNAVAYAYNAGVTIICAAGNAYDEGNAPEYPAAYDEYCIAVGATRFDRTHAPYSNTGSYLDIAAPGGDVTVDQNGDTEPDGVLQQTFEPPYYDDFSYWWYDGTSMACPHVAGVVALILARHPSWTPVQVRQALESTATDIGAPGRDDIYGWGLLDAYNAVASVIPSNSPPNPPSSPLCGGLTNPTGVNDPTPEFSWTFSDPDSGDTQGAYRVLVASTSGNLALDVGDMWDSGKVSSSAGEVSYAGTALTGSLTYYWKVKTWDNHDAGGPYCAQQQFETGTSLSEVWVDDDFTPATPGWGVDHFASIQDGIDAVTSPGTVHVAAGIYYENITLKDGVEVLGAGAGVTTIDGGSSGSVVTANNVGSGTKLDGFTITNGSAEYGGGMSNTDSSPTVSNCTFSGNSANSKGGGLYNSTESSPFIVNCTFSGNSADYGGGGMYNESALELTVTNCTFSGNSADYGGGMFNAYGSSPTVTNCTFSGNSANSHGGGIFNADNSLTIIINSIITGNTASTAGGIYVDDTSSPTIDYNDVWNNTPDNYYGCSAGANDISQDPLFVNPTADDYHLQPSSPCIDTGDNNAVPAWLTTDIDGNPRVVDGDGDTIAEVDMGVDEYMPLPNTVPEVTNVTASQGSTIVEITYDVTDAEQSDVTISFEYWDGDSWENCITATGGGTQSTGIGKSGTWDAGADSGGQYMTDCRIRVTADDGQAENNTGSGESNTFTLDTKDPTGYGCDTPANGATDVSINPNLNCLTASDDSPPISYYFQLAQNDTFNAGLQESGWQSGTSWSPSAFDYCTQYFWRVKAKDNYGNESAYGSTFSFTTLKELVSITITPDNPTVAKGRSQPFTATGTYSDDSKENLTASVTWSSDNLSVATIGEHTGLAQSLAEGQATIKATLGEIIGSTILTVEAHELDSVTVTPVNPSVTTDTLSVQFTATANYSDGPLNVTGSASWASDNTTVATIDVTGLATILSTGSTNISATYDSMTGSTTLQVATPPPPPPPAGGSPGGEAGFQAKLPF